MRCRDEGARLDSGRQQAGWLAALALALLLSATVFLLEPLKSLITNWDEVAVGFGALARELMAPGLAAFGALAAILLAANRIAPRRGLAIGVALYLLLWLQANVLIWRYADFDGTPIDWTEHSGKSALEAFLWLVALGIAAVRPPRFRRHWLRWVSAIAALQAASILGLWHAHAPLAARLEPVTDSRAEGLPVYSRTSNVIVIVLDALQSDFFSEALGDPAFRRSVPPGFTYYRNAISLYMHTEFSLQTMLTAEAVPDGVQYEEWGERALRQSVVSRLEQRGFESSFLVAGSGTLLCGLGGIDCIEPSELARDEGAFAFDRRIERDVDAMFRVGLFRLAPHRLKRFVYDAGSWRVPSLYPLEDRGEVDPRILPETRDDLRILRRLGEDVRVDGPPRFKFLHFRGAHFPATVDRDCSFSAQRYGETESLSKARSRFIGITRCVASRLFDYLRVLDRAGVYDNSLIIIVSDHGSPVIPVETQASLPPIPAAQPGAVPALANPWAGVALFLVKPRGARTGLSVSDRPVSLCDIPASIMESYGDAGDFACPSVFGAPADDRVRSHYRYPDREAQRAAGIRKLRRLDFTRYEVRGHSWRPESWQAASNTSLEGGR